MAFDPVSHAAGIGAGQEAGQRAAHDAELATMQAKRATSAAEISEEGAHDRSMVLAIGLGNERKKTAELQNEIYNKWIPYGVRLRASLMAGRVEKNHLIAALKESDPTNVERIAQEAVKLSGVEYARLGTSNSAALREVNDIVKAEAEAGRLG